MVYPPPCYTHGYTRLSNTLGIPVSVTLREEPLSLPKEEGGGNLCAKSLSASLEKRRNFCAKSLSASLRKGESVKDRLRTLG